MTGEQINIFIDTYKTGVGMVMAAQEAGATLAEARRDLRMNPLFRERFREAEAYLDEVALTTIFNEATDSAAAAAAYLKLKSENRLMKEKLREARRRAAMMRRVSEEEGAGELNLRLLDDDQFDRFRVLYAKTQDGTLEDDEKFEFANMMMIITSRRPAQAAITYDEDNEDEQD